MIKLKYLLMNMTVGIGMSGPKNIYLKSFFDKLVNKLWNRASKEKVLIISPSVAKNMAFAFRNLGASVKDAEAGLRKLGNWKT